MGKLDRREEGMISFCAGWSVVAFERVEIRWMFCAVGVAVVRSTGGRVTGGCRGARALRRKRWKRVNIFVPVFVFAALCFGLVRFRRCW
jgi:hypothetical protein